MQEGRMRIRSRHSRVWLVVVLTSVACSASSLLAQDTQDNLKAKLIFVPIRASEVMSAADQQRIGIDGLTPEQRFALDAWLTRYSAEVPANAFRDSRSSAALPSRWGLSAPLHDPARRPSRLDTGRWIVRSPRGWNTLGSVRAGPDVHRRVAGGRLHNGVAGVDGRWRLRPRPGRYQSQHTG